MTRTEVDSRFDQAWLRTEAVYNTLNAKVEEVNRTLGDRIDAHFRWTVGLIVATWISTIGTVLLK